MPYLVKSSFLIISYTEIKVDKNVCQHRRSAYLQNITKLT